MNIEEKVNQIQIDVAIIRADLDNQMAHIFEKVMEIANDVSKLKSQSESRIWGIVILLSGWLFGLLMLYLKER